MPVVSAESTDSTLLPDRPDRDDGVRYVFTLVYGTWANTALTKTTARISGSVQWYEAGSPFRSLIASQLPGSKFEVSHWTSRNSVMDRQKAAQQLSDNVRNVCQQYPNAEHFIIAHSHGGNIAQYALRDNRELQSRIAGVICLSTPFLHVMKRPLTDGMWTALLIFYLGSLVLYTYTYYYHDVTVWFWRALLLIKLLFPVMGYWLACHLLPISRTLLEKTQLPSNVSPRVLIVRTAADEASIALGMFQVASWAISKLIALAYFPIVAIEKADDIVRRRVKGSVTTARAVIMVIAIFIYGLVTPLWKQIAAIAMGATFAHDSDAVLSFFTNVATLAGLGVLWLGGFIRKRFFLKSSDPSIYSVSLALLITYIVGYIILVDLSRSLGQALIFLQDLTLILGPILAIPMIGPKLALSFLYFDVSVETAPKGFHTIYQFGSKRELKERIVSSLNHSIVYQTPDAISGIVSWIRGRDKA